MFSQASSQAMRERASGLRTSRGANTDDPEETVEKVEALLKIETGTGNGMLASGLKSEKMSTNPQGALNEWALGSFFP